MTVKYLSFPSKRAYGVELEVCTTGTDKKFIANLIGVTDVLHNVRVHSGWTTNTDNEDWFVKDDSSCGFEIVSYKSSGVKDLLNIANVANVISRNGVKVDNNCGYHIHVEIRDFSTAQVANLIAVWMKLEYIIVNALPKHRKNNKYCKFLNDYHEKWRGCDLNVSPEKFWDEVKPNLNGNFNLQRRVSLNTWNCACYFAGNSDRMTIEFRFPEGTLNGNDIKNWIRLLVNFVDSSKNMSFINNTKKSDLYEALYYLGISSLNDNYLILSDGMFSTKEWFLNRILKYSSSKKMCGDAIYCLNNMFSPVKSYELNDGCDAYFESI